MLYARIQNQNISAHVCLQSFIHIHWRKWTRQSTNTNIHDENMALDFICWFDLFVLVFIFSLHFYFNNPHGLLRPPSFCIKLPLRTEKLLALCSTLPPKLPPRNGSERFWTTVGVFTHGVWARLDQLLGVVCVFYCCLKWFLRLQSTWEGPEEEGLYNTKKKNGCEIAAGDWPFQGFVQQQWPPSLCQCEGVGHTWHWSCQAPRTVSNAPPLFTLLYLAVFDDFRISYQLNNLLSKLNCDCYVYFYQYSTSLLRLTQCETFFFAATFFI